MQQFSCNLHPPDQGYLIINIRVGGGGEGQEAWTRTWILIHHNVRDKLPSWLHTINYTNCPTVRPWRRPWSLLVLIKKHWNKTGWSSSPYNHSIRTFKLADSQQRKPHSGLTPLLPPPFCFCYESEIQLWKNVWDFRVKTKNDLFLQWLCV